MNKIGFIGGGAMAEAIIKGLIKQGKPPQNIFVSDLSSGRRQFLQETFGVDTFEQNSEVAQLAEVIILAVKPQNKDEALQSLSGFINSEKLLVSILAGVTTKSIEEFLPMGSKVIRVMPNTPALVGAGTTVLCRGSKVGEKEMEIAKSIFQAVGSVNILPEKLLNAATGLSGSGPAYVYLIIEALADGGVMAGLPRDIAIQLAAETVAGAAKMVSETKMHTAQLKDRVTSPGGTTICGILEMEKAGLRGTLMEAVMASARKAKELG